MAKVAYLSMNFGSYGTPILTGEEVMNHSGHNVGNFAFWNAARKLFKAEIKLFPFGAKASSLAPDTDFIVIPAANFLNDTADLGWLADLIVEVDKPVFVLGLGAQSEREEQIPTLKEGTVRFLVEAAKRTPRLALRGEFSKKVCSHYGVDNTEVLGCPSIFTNLNPRLGEILAANWGREFGRLAIHAASLKAHVRETERFLFRLLDEKPGSSYVVQRPVEFMKLAMNFSLNEKEAAYVDRARLFLSPNLTYTEFVTKLKRTVHIPYSVDSWRFYVRSFSHTLNTRIHGTLLSLSAEVPSICITHDTRTRELCSTLCVPSFDVKALGSLPGITEMFAEHVIVPEQFEANRKRLAASYRDILGTIALEPSKALSDFG